MDPRHPHENSYPRHPRHFFDPGQNFIDPHNPRDPHKFSTTPPTSPRNPRNLADCEIYIKIFVLHE